MPWNTLSPILVWAVLFVLITVWLWIKLPDNKLAAFLVVIDYTLFNLFFIQTLNWSLLNYWLRLVAILGCLVMMIRYLAHYSGYGYPWLPTKSTLWQLLLALALIPAMGYVNYRVYLSYSYASYGGEPVLLLLPVRNGMYVVANGGNGLTGLGMNDDYKDLLGRPKTADKYRIYSADIFKMEIHGNIASSVLPGSIFEYSSFGDFVYSPCPGEVVQAKYNYPDVAPFAEAETALGNYVVLHCFDYYVTLGNLQQNSNAVKVGDHVNLKVLVGYVGNSASNTIPHLIVYTTDGGWDVNPVPMLFDGWFGIDQFPVRNQIFLP
jgi:hypothetical protein